MRDTRRAAWSAYNTPREPLYLLGSIRCGGFAFDELIEEAKKEYGRKRKGALPYALATSSPALAVAITTKITMMASHQSPAADHLERLAGLLALDSLVGCMRLTIGARRRAAHPSD